MNNLFIISGPSGSGQDSIIDGLAKFLPIERVVTTTTREPRPGESEGHPYYFVSKDTFQEALAGNAFTEHAEHYNGNRYGVTRTELDRVIRSGNIGIWKVEYQGVEAAKVLFPGIIAILIAPPSLEVLEERLRRRDHPSEEYLAERMTYTKEMLKHASIYDYTIVNEEGRLEDAIEKTADIIRRHAKLS
jgi:guanylate kinase